MSVNFKGLLIGAAVGDAIGLPREGLSPKRALKLFGKIIQPALIVIPFTKRLTTCSDDTEHLWLTAQALLAASHQDTHYFQAQLAQRLKRWLFTLPIGIGKATLIASLKLCLGISPQKSGSFSAGNGSLMRAAVIGAFYANVPEKMGAILKASTCITHTDPKAYESAWVIAKAASLLAQNPLVTSTQIRQLFFDTVIPELKGQELRQYLELAQTMLAEQKTLEHYLDALSLSNGVTGYVNHTAPASIYAWLCYFGDYQATIEQIILAGGDTDTTAAIAGALAGMTSKNIPPQWLRSIYNTPLSLTKLEQLAEALKHQRAPPPTLWSMLLVKNLICLPVILFHGFRRLFPPY
ncbi:MAG: ADP-ribosylglycohydrolase family protein [Saezia sp.]